ncbi:MAG: hypothetical protein K2N33_02990 [Clostridia bacterium]|nr:hypothetical protein [Clostridia bacterium]
MPDYFSHGVAAEIIYEKLDTIYKKKITSKTLYLLGAQGGDVFFAYNIKPTKSNLGRSMHNMNVANLFEKLLGGNPSYVAGFATHYALDCTLHPAIYAYESTKKSPFAHHKFEKDLGLFISRKYGLRRQIIPREKLLACTFSVYDTIKRVEPLVTVTGVERCLKRHFSISKFLYRGKKQEYKCEYDFNTLTDLIDDSVTLGVQAVKSVLDGNADPQIFNKHFLQK